jgi:5-amino-6-(D-ribitylamino)uracil---L-tyrosine 4-hydroxyphenyl transferase
METTMLTDVYERSLAGQITKEDAMALVEGNPFELFETTDALRKEIVGDKVTYVVNRLVEITDR